MDYKRLKELSNYIPFDSKYYIGLNGQVNSSNKRNILMNKFLWSYKDLAFGYHFVKLLIQTNTKLPAGVKETYLRDAYNYEKFGIIRPKDDSIVHAISLTIPCMRNEEVALQSFLLKDISFKDISLIMGIPESVIRAYEQLFYNVRDRKKDAMYLASVIYPQSRLVELMDSYMKNESMQNLLIRGGYNGNIDDIKYIFGLRCDSGLKETTPSQLAASFEASIMSNGAILANMGLASQKAIANSKAENFLIAAKQGGTDTDNGMLDSPASFGDALSRMIMEDKT